MFEVRTYHCVPMEFSGGLENAYAIAREANIRKNMEEMKSLGLFEETPTAEGADLKPKKKMKRESAQAVPSRKSRRLQSIEPEIQLKFPRFYIPEIVHYDESETKDWSLMEFKLERLRALHEATGQTYKNPTATYEHTWMRVKTMSEAALKNRIKAIERALGQHCIVKMRMFGEVLILADMLELAQLANESLARLEALVDPKI